MDDTAVASVAPGGCTGADRHAAFCVVIKAAELLLRQKKYDASADACTTALMEVSSAQGLSVKQLTNVAHELLWLRGLSHMGRRDFQAAREDARVSLVFAPTKRKSDVITSCIGYLDGVIAGKQRQPQSEGADSQSEAGRDAAIWSSADALTAAASQSTSPSPDPGVTAAAVTASGGSCKRPSCDKNNLLRKSPDVVDEATLPPKKRCVLGRRRLQQQQQTPTTASNEGEACFSSMDSTLTRQSHLS